MSDVFIPAQFSKLGKATKDLIKKKFQSDTEIKTINKSNEGLPIKLEIGCKYPVGFVKTTVENFLTDGTKFEGEVDTLGTVTGKGTYKNYANLNGLELILSGKFAEKGNCAKFETNYERDMIAFNASSAYDSKKLDLGASAVVGAEGVSCGVGVTGSYETDFAMTDVNVGVQYQQDDFSVALTTQNKLSTLTTAYYQKITGALQIGASYLLPDKGKAVLTAAAEYDLDKDSTLKVKANTEANICFLAEHRMKNPMLKFAVGSDFDCSGNDLVTKNFGVGLTFGDY